MRIITLRFGRFYEQLLHSSISLWTCHFKSNFTICSGLFFSYKMEYSDDHVINEQLHYLSLLMK